MNRASLIAAAAVGIVILLVVVWRAGRRSVDEPISERSPAAPRAAQSSESPTPVTAGTPTMMDPKRILFSMPTICDLAPPVTHSAAGAGAGNQFVLHEDDWRQVELVARADHAAVSRMLDEVRASARDNRDGAGWKNVYVRKEHPTPIGSLSLTAKMIGAAFGDIKPQRVALSSGGAGANEVRGGFAFAVAGLGTLYGKIGEDESVRNLAIVPTYGAIDPASRDKLNAFCRAHDLEIIDWQRQDWVDPEMALWAKR